MFILRLRCGPRAIMSQLQRTAQLSTGGRSVTLHKSASSVDPVFSAQSVKNLSQDELMNFKAILPDLVYELTYEGAHKELPDINEHLAKVIWSLINLPMHQNTSFFPFTVHHLHLDRWQAEQGHYRPSDFEVVEQGCGIDSRTI
jgi:hypothetical protein